MSRPRARAGCPHHIALQQWIALRRRAFQFLRRRTVRRLLWGTTTTLVLVVVAAGGLWWRLSIGPIELDLATPWLKKAIEDDFGGAHTVSVGGTQLERDENGRISLRLRGITVRAADGTVVASAPKAEVGLSGPQPARPAMCAPRASIWSRRNGGAHREERRRHRVRRRQQAPDRDRCRRRSRPASPGGNCRGGGAGALGRGRRGWPGCSPGLTGSAPPASTVTICASSASRTAISGRRRAQRQALTFSKINVEPDAADGRRHRLSALSSSDNTKQPWVFTAQAIRPVAEGVRAIGLEARNVSSADILLALRLSEDRGGGQSAGVGQRARGGFIHRTQPRHPHPSPQQPPMAQDGRETAPPLPAMPGRRADVCSQVQEADRPPRRACLRLATPDAVLHRVTRWSSCRR